MGVRIVLRRGPVREKGGTVEIGRTGCDGKRPFPSQKPNCVSVQDCPFTPPYQQARSQSSLSLTLLD